MITLVFNSEVDLVENSDDAVACINDALEAFDDFMRGVKAIGIEYENTHPLTYYVNLAYDSSAYIRLKDNFVQIEYNSVNIESLDRLLAEFNVATPIDVSSIEARHIISGLGVPSSILDYALNNNAILFTFAFTTDWKCDVISFTTTVKFLPNLWNRQSVEPAIRFYRQHQRPLDRLKIQYKAVIAPNALDDSSLSADEWKSVFRGLDACCKNGFIIIETQFKRCKQAETAHGVLHELKEDGLRLFILPPLFDEHGELKRKLVVGGVFKKASLNAQRRAINTAVSRINRLSLQELI